MNRYVVTPPAKFDLFDIWDYIADKDGLDRADHVVQEIRSTMEKLAESPGIGHQRDDLADESLRIWSVFSFLIIYRPETAPLEIIRILHGARDLPAIIEHT